MRKILIYLLILMNMYSKNITAVGYGLTEDKAKKEVVEFISKTIILDVKKNYLDENKLVKNLNEEEVYLKSILPLVGVVFTSEYKEGKYEVEGVLSNESIEVYESKFEKIKIEIKKLEEILSVLVEKDQQSNIIKAILNKIDNYNRYYSIYLFITDGETKYNFLNKNFYEQELRKKEESYNNLDYAIFNTFKNFSYKKIYICSPIKKEKMIASEFENVIEYKIKDTIANYTNKIDEANYILKGNYELYHNNVIIEYRLIDLEGYIKENCFLNLNKNAYKNYKLDSKIINFTKSFNKKEMFFNNFN